MKLKRKPDIILFLFFAIVMNGTLWAQSDIHSDSLWQLELPNVVITGQYVPTHSKNAVHEVKVINIAEIQQQGYNNLAEVLSDQLNLRIQTDPVLGSRLKIQGIDGQNIQVMIDGVPVIGRIDGNIDLSQISFSNIDRIEIIEGAMSAQYGSNASGGVINIIYKKSQIDKFRIQSENQYEDIGILNNSLSLSTQQDKLYANIHVSRYHSQFAPEDSLRLYSTEERSDGTIYRTKEIPWNPKTQYSIGGSLRYRFSDSLRIGYQYQHFDEELINYGIVQRPQFRPYARDEYFTTRRSDHSIHVEAWLSPTLYLHSTTAYNTWQREKKTELLDFEPDTASLFPGGQDTSDFNAFLHRTTLSTATHKTLSGQLGIEVYHEMGSGSRITDSTSLPIHTARLHNYALWGSLRHQLTKDMTVLANVRYGYNTKYDHPLIPSVHFNWKPTAHWDMKLSYAHGFRAPSLKELHFNFIDINHHIIGNSDLQPEHSKNISASAQYTTGSKSEGQFSATAKLFYNTIANRIVLTEFAQLQYNYQNLDHYETHGANLRLQYSIKRNLTIASGLAYTRLSDIGTPESEKLQFTSLPEMQNELQYLLPKTGVRLSVIHRFFGRQVRFIENIDATITRGFIGEYHLLNASMHRSFWKNRITLAVGAKNIFDVQSFPFSGEVQGIHSSAGNSLLLGWGRTFFMRMNINVGL